MWKHIEEENNAARTLLNACMYYMIAKNIFFWFYKAAEKKLAGVKWATLKNSVYLKYRQWWIWIEAFDNCSQFSYQVLICELELFYYFFYYFLCENIFSEVFKWKMSSKSVTVSNSYTVSNWTVHLMQGLDYSKSMYHDDSRVAGDHLFIYSFSFLPAYTLLGFYVSPPNFPLSLSTPIVTCLSL